MEPLKNINMISKPSHLSYRKQVTANSSLVKSASVVFEKGVGAPNNE